jgi:hypothetical protein
VKFEYRQWHKGDFTLGLGFDPDETFMVKFQFDLCLKHRDGQLSFMLFGGMFDIYWLPEVK